MLLVKAKNLAFIICLHVFDFLLYICIYQSLEI